MLGSPYLGQTYLAGEPSKTGIYTKVLTATVSFTGSIKRFISTTLTSTLGLASLTNKYSPLKLAGMLSFIGSFSKRKNAKPSPSTLQAKLKPAVLRGQSTESTLSDEDPTSILQ